MGTTGAFGVELLPLLLGALAGAEADGRGPFDAGATAEGADFSCIGLLEVDPTPLGSPLCFARSANARFILRACLLPEDQSGQQPKSQKFITSALVR